MTRYYYYSYFTPDSYLLHITVKASLQKKKKKNTDRLVLRHHFEFAFAWGRGRGICGFIIIQCKHQKSLSFTNFT